jgi:hypothetical protein
MECMNDIDLNILSRDFHNMRRDVLWATCPHCESTLLPKIGVRLGNELNRYHKLQYETSSYEAIVLYSPFFLKYNYNNGLLKEFGNKLDVENFKMRFNAVFWDSIWYFKAKNLDFEFMLPYEYSVNLSTFSTLNNHIKVNNIPVINSKYQLMLELYNEKNIKGERRGTKDKAVKNTESKDVKEPSISKSFKDKLIIQDKHIEVEILTNNLVDETVNNNTSSFQDNTTRFDMPYNASLTLTEDYSNLIDNKFVDISYSNYINDKKKFSCPLNIIREESRNTILSTGDDLVTGIERNVLSRKRTRMRSDYFLYQKGNEDNSKHLEEILEFDDYAMDKTPV